MDYRKVNDCFKISETIRAKHLLYEDFKQERIDITKFIFYLWLQENQLKAKIGKDENGYLGHGLEFVPNGC